MADAIQPQLAWEARHRRRAGLAATLAGLATLVAGVLSGITYRDVPRVSVLDSLLRVPQPGAVDDLPSLRTPVFEYLQDHAAQLIGGSVVSLLGYLGVAYALFFLGQATRARRSAFPRIALYAGVAGAVLYGLYALVAQVAQQSAISDFLDGPRTVADAEDVSSGGLLVFAQFLYIPATLALALGLIFVSLNAMRAGLLTRFMGVLGIMLGVLLVFPLLPYGGSLMQVFWLAALGVLLLGRWPGGTPPAWAAGKEIPWLARSPRQPPPPRRPRKGADLSPERAPVTSDTADKPQPRKKKRKQKRRA